MGRLPHPVAVFVSAIGLAVGCSDGSNGASSAPSTAAPLTATHGPPLTGVVRPASPEALVHLVGPVTSATLPMLAEAVYDSQPVGPDGAFTLERLGPGPWRVLVSAPGRALTWVDVVDGAPLEVTPAPEARLTLALRGPDGPEALAAVLVLDPTGTPLPLEVEHTVGDEQGTLAVGRLPAGRLELLVISLDLSRVARAEVELRAGETTPLELSLREDPALLGRALRLVGQDELAALVAGEEVTR